jgi:glycosidase
LFEKLPIFWAIAERRPEFPKFYKRMMTVRRESVALRRGSLEWLHNSDESRVVTFVRRAGNDEVVVAINFSNRPFWGLIQVSKEANGKAIPISLEAWGYKIITHD